MQPATRACSRPRARAAGDARVQRLSHGVSPRGHRGRLEQLQKAAELGVKNVFIQPGAESDEILAFCASKGITVRQGCVLREL